MTNKIDDTKLNRVEVIEKGLGRSCVVYSSNIELELQDDNQTLKIFVGYPKQEDC